MITDGRFSGGSHGFIIGHVAPEAQVGGPIALIENGDTIRIDADTCTIDVTSTHDGSTLDSRRENWVAPPFAATSGTLYKFIKNVSSAKVRGALLTRDAMSFTL